jgi:hypothetical protein
MAPMTPKVKTWGLTFYQTVCATSLKSNPNSEKSFKIQHYSTAKKPVALASAQTYFENKGPDHCGIKTCSLKSVGCKSVLPGQAVVLSDSKLGFEAW